MDRNFNWFSAEKLGVRYTQSLMGSTKNLAVGLLALLIPLHFSQANDLPLWSKCAVGLAHLVGRGYQLQNKYLYALNEKLTAEGRSEERVREAFGSVVQPKITPTSRRGYAKFIHVGYGDSVTVSYAYGTYPGAEPPLIGLIGPGGKTVYTPVEGASMVGENVARGTQWPLVVRDRYLIPTHDKMSNYLETQKTMIALGKSGEGPEVVFWGIRREHENDPKSDYILRTVTKNLAYGENILAAGTLPELSYAFSQLPPDKQRLAAKLLVGQACHHPDPHVGNSYLVIRKGAQGDLELKPYYVDMDGGLGLLRATLPGSYADTVAGRADIFQRLQKQVLEYFPNGLSRGRLIFRATELFGDTPDNRAIDAHLFP